MEINVKIEESTDSLFVEVSEYDNIVQFNKEGFGFKIISKDEFIKIQTNEIEINDVEKYRLNIEKTLEVLIDSFLQNDFVRNKIETKLFEIKMSKNLNDDNINIDLPPFELEKPKYNFDFKTVEYYKNEVKGNLFFSVVLENKITVQFRIYNNELVPFGTDFFTYKLSMCEPENKISELEFYNFFGFKFSFIGYLSQISKIKGFERFNPYSN